MSTDDARTDADAGQAAGPPTAGTPTTTGPCRRARSGSGRVSMRPGTERHLDGDDGVRRTEDEKLLAGSHGGPRFLETDTWRALRILSEFVEGFEALAGVGRAVAVFGSARTAEGSEAYELARQRRRGARRCAGSR